MENQNVQTPKENEEGKTEVQTGATENFNEGNPEKPALIRNAEDAAARLERANKEREELLKREENLMAEKRLGGKTSFEEKKEEKDPLDDPLEYSKAVARGEVNPFKV